MPPSSYGLATDSGSGPLADFSKPIHVLLKEAVAAAWSSITTDPPVSDIYWSNVWFTDASDVEMIFLHSVEIRDPSRRSVDWAYMSMATFVDIHIFVRGLGMDEEPDLLHKVRIALDKLVETNRETLIPNAVVTLEGSNYITERDNQQNLWHWIYSCSVRYWKVVA